MRSFVLSVRAAVALALVLTLAGPSLADDSLRGRDGGRRGRPAPPVVIVDRDRRPDVVLINGRPVVVAGRAGAHSPGVILVDRRGAGAVTVIRAGHGR